MRKLSFLLLAGALFLGISCTPDLKDVYDRLGALEERMAELTTTTETANSAFTIANALKDKVYVDSVTETEDGYVIKFSNGTTATIKDGEPGQDATAPTIGIKEVDGELVWTVNDQVVKDASGKPVPATVKVPEFKFDNNKWWYRFGAEDTWKDCGEKTGPEPSITEDEEYVYITIGGNQVAIPKAVIAPSIESITAKLKPSKLFIPVGKSADLKDFFEVGPEGALKTSVNYDYAAGAFEIDDKGIITVTGNSTDANPSDNFVVVTVSAKNDPDIKTTFYVRSCPTPANEEPESTCTVPEADRLYLFNNTPESFSSFVSIGGQGCWNPINNSVSGLMGPGGKANIYFRAPAVTNPALTLANGHLHFKYYVSTVEKLNLADGFVELTSTELDHNELSWTGKLGDVKAGWNEIDLAFKDGVDSGIPDYGPFDPTVLSFFRLNIPTSANNDEAVQVKDLFVYAETTITAITSKIKPSKLFIPVGKSADLKDFFDVAPAGMDKSGVEYSYAEGAFTISDDGIITVTGNTVTVNPDNFVAVTVSAKNNPDIKTTFYVRSCPTPANEEPESTCTVPEADRLYLFNNTPESFSSFVSIGGQGSWNPINNSVSGLMGPGGKANIYFKAPEVKNPSFTLANGHLHFKYYVSTVEKLNLADALVELTSTVLDNNELSWTGKLGDVKVGWNEIDLAFKDGVDSGIPDFGPFDPTVLSFFRLNISTSANNDEAVQVKDLFVYAEEGPVQITIDGDMSDWAKVKGATNDAAEARYAEFKMASDETNLYFYTRRTTFQYTDIWNGKGYVYYAFDLDNDASTGGSTLWENGPYEFIFVIWPFAGTSDAPAFAATPLGDSTILPSGDIKTHYNANGTFDPAKGAELEFSIPRADLPAIPASKITVYSWGNKGGENMKSHPISVTL
ncbi:MAG: hypothetical protein IKX71_01810 [Bacteroidales bacterium]|nr:hypothetical protein [Bacteroidales bacterium]